MGKLQGKLQSFDMVQQVVKEKENYEIKPAVLLLRIDLM